MSILTRQNGFRSKTILRLSCCAVHIQKEIDVPSKKCCILWQYFSNKGVDPSQKLTKKRNVDIESTTKRVKVLKSPRPTLHTSKHLMEITNYFETKECLAEIFPKIQGKYIRRRYKYPDSQFLVDKEIAVELISAIKPDLLQGDSHVFELNPGPGVITEQLLLNHVKKLKIFEGDSNFILHLNELVISHKRKIKITPFNFLRLPSLIYQDQCDNGNRFEKLMVNVKRKPWDNSSPAIKMIAALAPTVSGNIIRYITYSIIYQNGLTAYGRPELYLFMQPHAYLQMTSTPDSGYVVYRSFAVIFSLFFETKLIKKIPRNAIVPWCCKYVAKKRSKISKLHAVDVDQMYFVKITARQDLLTVIRPDMLKPLWYFLRHHLLSRKNRVIPMLERWIPGCGPRLVAEGMTIFTQFGDLYPQELLSLFKLFTSWPEFNSCPFLASMEATLLKMEIPGNEDVLEEEDVDVEEETEVEKESKKSKS